MEKKTYTLDAICSNCEHEWTVEFENGVSGRGMPQTCPHCGCFTGKTFVKWERKNIYKLL